MAQKTINDLDAATTPLDGTEEVELEQSSASKKATTQDVADLARVSGGTTDHLVSIAADDDIEDSGIAKADVTAAKNHADGDGSDHADVASNTTHRGTTSGNPHSVAAGDLSLDTDDDVEFQSLELNGDNDADDVAYVRMIVFLTDGDGDPTWSNYPEGTIFMWKEA